MSFTSPITLTPDTKYYVSIVNETLSDKALWAWVESETGENGFYWDYDNESLGTRLWL